MICLGAFYTCRRYGSNGKVSLNSCFLIFKPCQLNDVKYTKICTCDNPRWNWCSDHWCNLFLHLHKDLSANFGGVAKYLLRSILQRDGKVIHFVSDKWITLSIKDCERQSRNAADISYQITSAGQKRLINWLTALLSSSFKTSLVEFFVSAWSNSDYSLLFEGKILFANCGSICYKFLSILDKAARTKEMSLSYTLTERSR